MVKAKPVWNNDVPMSAETRELFEDAKALYKLHRDECKALPSHEAWQHAQQTAERALIDSVGDAMPQGKTFAFSYLHGNVSVALVDVKKAKANNAPKPGSLVDWLRSQQQSGLKV